ncbi:dTDP-4-dehydrorhamnose reductase [Microbulbifer sp. EKSA008]|uniref:dTDP-4-dehydrorhamnose reductase n=1 Tax=unclassified Microbulbifer TaxID=2619833 RepID=UPI0040398995
MRRQTILGLYKMATFKILITGKNGQLGRELQKLCPVDIEMVAMGREELDISNKQVVQAVIGEVKPDVIINTAAYTAVDKAEQEENVVFAINKQGSENLAEVCNSLNIRLIHVSTDFVFDGEKSAPYLTSDKVNPVGVYGSSKAEAETAVLRILPEAIIVRTAWVYASHGNNFMNTMLRLMADRDQLSVVADQVGTPTWTGTLAEILIILAQKPSVSGIYHCTDLGVASWYDFAVAIYEEGKILGVLSQDKQLDLKAIATHEYPTPAKRPSYSVLDKTRLITELDIKPRHWRESLRLALSEKKQQH